MTAKWDEITNKLGDLVEEAEELRHTASAGTITDDLQSIHERLLRVRAAQDRVEEIVAIFMRAKRQTDQGVRDAKHAFEAKWDSVVTGGRKVGFSISDPAPRERYAHYNQETIGELFDLRAAEKANARVGTALDLCRWYHQGLDGVRWTLNSRLRLMTIDTRLEH